MTKLHQCYLKHKTISKILTSVALMSLLATTPVSNVESSENPADLSIELTQIDLFIKTEQLDKAFSKIAEIKKKYPQNPDLLLAEANANYHAGYWRKSATLLNQAQKLAPDNENIKDALAEVNNEHSTEIGAEREIVLTGNSSMEQFTRMSGQYRFGDSCNIGLNLENNKIRVTSITRTNGVTTRVEDEMQRGEIFLKHAYENGIEGKVSIFGANNIAGVGGEVSIPDNYGKFIIDANLNRPSWDFKEQVIDEGFKDNIGITREQRIIPRLIGSLGADFNLYGIDGDRAVAKSTSVDTKLSYIIPSYSVVQDILGDNIYMSLNYDIHAEYAHSVDQRLDNTATLFKPVPLKSYELHHANFYLSKGVIRKLYLEAFGGYVVDRLGGDGPNYGGAISYDIIDGFQAKFLAARDISTEDSSDDVERIGFYLTKKFQP